MPRDRLFDAASFSRVRTKEGLTLRSALTCPASLSRSRRRSSRVAVIVAKIGANTCRAAASDNSGLTSIACGRPSWAMRRRFQVNR